MKRLLVRDRLDGCTCSDTPKEGNYRRDILWPARSLFGEEAIPNFERAAVVVTSAEILFCFEGLNVLVNGCEGRQAKPGSDFLVAGTITVICDELRQEVHDFLLTPRKCQG